MGVDSALSVSALLCPGEHQNHGEATPATCLSIARREVPSRSAGVTLTRPTATSSDTASCARSSVTGLFSRSGHLGGEPRQGGRATHTPPRQRPRSD